MRRLAVVFSLIAAVLGMSPAAALADPTPEPFSIINVLPLHVPLCC